MNFFKTLSHVLRLFVINCILDVSIGTLSNNTLMQNKISLGDIHLPNYLNFGTRFKRTVELQNNHGNQRLKLIDEFDCKQDIKRLCGTLQSNSDDLLVLECVQSFKANALADIDERCQHAIWKHTIDLINDRNLLEISEHACNQDITNLKCKSSDRTGKILGCMIDHREDIESVKCRALVQRLEWVAFSDFRIIGQFADDCHDDIEKYKCGRLQVEETISQGQTLSCLQLHIDQLVSKCHKQILHLSEMQADDITFDRQLYLACVNDHLKFCHDIAPGSGKVYKCLMQHKLDNTMSSQCQEQLTRRQKLIAQDYRVSKGLARACKDDIRTFHCRRLVSDDKDIRLAQILLCLEGAIRNGTRLSQDCQMEMVEHRKILMEDFRLSPEIVSRCHEDIPNFCSGLEVGGKTIHCLMEHTRTKKKRDRISVQCQRALEMLVKEADVGEDWRVDPVLREACKPVVDLACKEVQGGNARVMSCLMEKLGKDYMTEACETALLQIQYFVARDFKLDPQLYHHCRDDAIRFCHAKKVWYDRDDMDPERGPLVLPCLYRYAYRKENTMQLKSSCLEEIRRVMRQRAVSVDLQPEVEELCLSDLASFCFEKTLKGEEMVCLQDNLEKLDNECKLAVSNFTEEEAEHIELNPIIMSVCQGVMERHCQAELKMGKDEGDIMECLIEHKNEHDVRENYKCRAAIEHFQLISLNNYHFTYKFKEACRTHVMRFCPGSKTKYDVIVCLSEKVRNDTLKDTKHNVPRDCRQQLKAQLFQQRENIDFDPRLKNSCATDIQKFCSDAPKGAAQVLECLQTYKSSLKKSCHQAIFNVEKQELQDSSSDYTLITTCRHMIRQFCHEEDQSQALECLKRYKDETTFDHKCKLIVVRRMIEQNRDYRFNPLLQKGCRHDISKFCSSIVATEPQDKELDGKVIHCLKVQFRERKLSKECEQHMATILREAALNYRLNPLLAALCKNEIKRMCVRDENEVDESGTVEECLKMAFINHRIMDPSCKMEVASIIEEAKADIHVDPILHEACGIDVSKYCKDIPQGAGRHIQCLQLVLQDSTKSLQPDCSIKLTKRIEMFENAQLAELENFGQLYSQVSRSPAKKYFMIVAFSMVGIIFIAGLFCGRVTRRTIMMKNK